MTFSATFTSTASSIPCRAAMPDWRSMVIGIMLFLEFLLQVRKHIIGLDLIFMVSYIISLQPPTQGTF